MTISPKFQRILAATMTLAAIAIFTWTYWPTSQAADHCAMHAAKMAQWQEGQGQEPEGNPGHDPNKEECSPRPTGKMIACVCHKWRKCDGSEPRSCSNFCHFRKCKCPTPCV